MKPWRHGLVIGKLRPPHAGHAFLIRTALEQVEALTVIICADDSDTVPADLRAAWLRGGAEPTGKTTPTRRLAEHYRTVWGPEYGRLYTEVMPDPEAIAWATPDFIHIAEAQSALEDLLARHANRILICDTDPFTT